MAASGPITIGPIVGDYISPVWDGVILDCARRGRVRKGIIRVRLHYDKDLAIVPDHVFERLHRRGKIDSAGRVLFARMPEGG